MKLPGDFDHGGTEAVTDSARILNNFGPSQAPSHTGAIVFFDQSE